MKLRIDDNLSEKDIQFVLDWIQKLANAIMDADDTVVEDESSSIEEVTSASLPKITKEKFVNALDTIGKNIFARLFAMADENALLVKWGTKGFSLNVKKNNDQIPICQGYPPQSSIYQQAIRITSEGKYGFLNKVPMSESVMKPLFSEAQNSGLFQLEGNGNGNGLKLRLDDNLSEKDIQFVLDWIQKLANAIIDADTVNP
ncbi:hypothetical protein LJC22_01970 [Desulfosarcina sp. OttesenSCG-928-G10]|nr:hypothetical protein [Desulfosarcina sp. OttesenSCG-928-G10]